MVRLCEGRTINWIGVIIEFFSLKLFLKNVMKGSVKKVLVTSFHKKWWVLSWIKRNFLACSEGAGWQQPFLKKEGRRSNKTWLLRKHVYWTSLTQFISLFYQTLINTPVQAYSRYLKFQGYKTKQNRKTDLCTLKPSLIQGDERCRGFDAAALAHLFIKESGVPI